MTMDQDRDPRIGEELRKLALLLSQAADTLHRLADLFTRPAPPAAPEEPLVLPPAPPPPELSSVNDPSPTDDDISISPDPPPPPPRPAREPDEIDRLSEEIEQVAPHLDRLAPRGRNAQLAIWAGRARELQDRSSASASASESIATPSDRAHALVGIFGRLTRLVKEAGAGWIDALTRDWSTDWRTYIEYHEALLAGRRPDLPSDRHEAFHRAILRRLRSQSDRPRPVEHPPPARVRRLRPKTRGTR